VGLKSAYSTSILAWYTGVNYEIKPVKSGYRLALYYHLVHKATRVPKPVLPQSEEAIAALRRAFQRWHTGAYDFEPDSSSDSIAYILEHKYTTTNLTRGSKALKGSDAHLISHLQPTAADWGYMVCLAELSWAINGKAKLYSCWSALGTQSSEDCDCDETPPMDKVEKVEITVNNAVDL
jgi:hypothetical protein